MDVDNSTKYLYLKYEGRNAYEIVKEVISDGKMPLHGVKRIRELFPFLSLLEAKEIVAIATSEHKSLYDYQGSLFSHLEELHRLNEEDKI